MTEKHVDAGLDTNPDELADTYVDCRLESQPYALYNMYKGI